MDRFAKSHQHSRDLVPPYGEHRRGLVLILVLVVIALLGLVGFAYSDLMLAERKAAVLSAGQVQARASTDSGLETIRFFLTKDKDAQDQAGGWYNNPARFRGVLVNDDANPQRRARFSIVSPAIDDQNNCLIRFGLEDESTRLNLSTLLLADKSVANGGRTILMGLPGMTEQIADAILDWIDADDETREFGAEADYYSSQSPPYAPKNGPLETVEELLLVRDVTPGLLFGSDVNRNGLLDAMEQQTDLMSNVDNTDGSMTRGWSAYLTLWSQESNLRPDGTARVNLNQSDIQKLYDELADALGNDEWATYIVAYRQNGPSTGTTTTTGGGVSSGTLDFTKKAKVSFSSVLDVIGSPVSVTFVGDEKPTILPSPFPNDPGSMGLYLPTIMDNLTTNSAKVIPGRININQAPKVVLAGIPGMTPDVLDAIVSARTPDPTQSQANRRYETWILAESIVTLEQMKALMPFVTGGGNVYRAQVIGYFDQGGPAVRIEAVIDATAKPPKIMFWRDLSHLGRGYSVETLGVAAPDF